MSPALGINEVPTHVREKLRYQYPGVKFIGKSKFNNHTCICMNKNHAPHRSIFEANYCNGLFVQKIPYVTQFKIEMKVGGLFICNHYMDFAVFKTWRAANIRKNPTKLIETKGPVTEEWRIKSRLVKALLPRVPYQIVFQRGRH